MANEVTISRKNTPGYTIITQTRVWLGHENEKQYDGDGTPCNAPPINVGATEIIHTVWEIIKSQYMYVCVCALLTHIEGDRDGPG